MPKRTSLTPRDKNFVDYVIAHPKLSETACAKALGWKGGAALSGLLKRTRKEIDARTAANSKKVDKEAVKKAVVTRLLIEQRALELAQLEPLFRETITGQVNALRLLAEMGGHIVNQTRDLTGELKGKTTEQLEYLAIHGYWPTTVDAGKPGATESESSSQSPSEPAKKPN